MSFPAGLQTVTVNTGPHLAITGTPLAGRKVRLTPEWKLQHEPSGAWLMPTAATVVLDVAGTGSVVVPASDAAGLVRSNVRYLVSYDFGSGVQTPAPFFVLLPAAVPVVDLEALAPAEGTDGSTVSIPTVTSVAGVSGAVTAQEVADALNGAGNRLSDAALRAALVPFWEAGETVTAGTVRVDATGHLITRNANGTTRGSYDATEQAAWTVVSGGGGGPTSAAGTSYDGATSGLASTTVQGALDEVVADYQAADAATVTAARNGVLLTTDLPLVDHGQSPAGSEETMSTTSWSGNFNLTAGTLFLTYFTPRLSRTVTKIRGAVAGTAASPTPTLARMGIYSVAGDGSLTLVGACASDTAMFAAATSWTPEEALTASVALTKGQRYAIGLLQVGATTAPKVYGQVTGGALNADPLGVVPVKALQVPSQTDLPSSLAVASLATTPGMFYAYVR